MVRGRATAQRERNVATPPAEARAPGQRRSRIRPLGTIKSQGLFVILGKFLISVGVGILLFVWWTLWGTGLHTEREQRRLALELDRRIVAAAEETPKREARRGGPPKRFAPAPGEPVFRMSVPKIGMSAVVVEGVGRDELRKGPGHYPTCRPGFERPFCSDLEAAWPGERDRVVLGGHRTTYGAEFHRIDELNRGDKITIEAEWGRFVYRVTRHEIVDPDSRDVIVPTGRAEVALVTCNPKYSAAERLIVYAELEKA